MGGPLEINNCKHYFLNEKREKVIYFIHNNYLVEKDFVLKHPLGTVYKPKTCIDTDIRFVKQPDNSTLMFNAKDWNVPENPFYVPFRPTFKAQMKALVNDIKKVLKQ